MLLKIITWKPHFCTFLGCMTPPWLSQIIKQNWFVVLTRLKTMRLRWCTAVFVSVLQPHKIVCGFWEGVILLNPVLFSGSPDGGIVTPVSWAATCSQCAGCQSRSRSWPQESERVSRDTGDLWWLARDMSSLSQCLLSLFWCLMPSTANIVQL